VGFNIGLEENHTQFQWINFEACRMKSVFGLAVLALSVALQSGIASACETPRGTSPLAAKSFELREMLLSGRFDELERSRREASDLSRTVSDGQSVLIAFDGLARVPLPPCGGAATADRMVVFAPMRVRLDEWKKAMPESSLARFEEAMFYEGLAWAMRGKGVASTVAAEAWGDFRTNIAKAAAILDAAPEGERDVLWFDGRLRIGLAEGMPEPRFNRLFEQGLKQYPEFVELAVYAAPYYSQKWYGSREDAIRFVDGVAPRVKGTDPDVAYARMWWSANDQDMFTEGVRWDRFASGFRKLIEGYPDPWNVNHFALFACFAGDQATLKSLLARIDQPVMAAWRDPRFYQFCRSLAG
jgi:hypothetical protein